MIKTIKWGHCLELLSQIEMDIIRYMHMFMILFGIKYYSTDISGFLKKGNSDLNLHCFMIYHVHAQVSKYKMP